MYFHRLLRAFKEPESVRDFIGIIANSLSRFSSVRSSTEQMSV